MPELLAKDPAEHCTQDEGPVTNKCRREDSNEIAPLILDS